VTNPVGLISLILWLRVSAMKMFPELSTMIPYGKLKLANVPIPSAYKSLPEPANVETKPATIHPPVKIE